MLIWVPANWVAAGLTGLPEYGVEIVALGRDVGQPGDVGDVTVPESVAEVEFYVPSFFPSAAGVRRCWAGCRGSRWCRR